MTEHGHELFGIERKRALLAVALAVGLGLAAFALLAQATSLDKAVTAVRHAEKPWFAGLLAGQLIAYGGYALGYRTIARACGGPRFPYWTTLRLSIVSFGAYVLASSAGGLGVDFWALHRAGERAHAAGRRVLAFNILEWAVLGSAASLAALLSLVGLGHSAPAAMTIAWLVVTPACIAAALWVSRAGAGERHSRLPRFEKPEHAGWLTRARLRWLWGEVRVGFADSVGALVFLRTLLARPHRYWGAPVGFAVYWLGDLLTLYTGIRALGGAIGPLALLLAYATGYVVTSAPLPAGAAGFSEAATAGTLSLVGLPLGTAIFAVFLYRAFTFWLPLIPAAALLAHVRGLAHELERAPREENATCALDG